ncbi:RTA1-domain-containing protein [Marasmius fiardii PR-910]|nr:RTA1-domain-containing protein [Marasmius fiardii PR-910]
MNSSSTNPPPVVPLDDHLNSPYGYRPTLWICILYVALFSTSLGIHFQQMISSRYWFLAPTVILGAFLEILGWIGRLWSNQNLWGRDPFMMQICCLVLGPTPILAANFVVFGRMVGLLGQEFSRLRPRLYTYIFLSCDIVSLIVQGAAGGLSATAYPGTAEYKLGTNLMIAGIALQVAMMTIFVILVGEYIVRYVNNRPLQHARAFGFPSTQRFPLDTRRQILLSVMGITTLLLFVRGVYRLIELSGGWDSTVAQTEWLFNVFDAACVTIALFTWNIAHPSLLLERHPNTSGAEEDVRMKQFQQRTSLDRVYTTSDDFELGRGNAVN